MGNKPSRGRWNGFADFLLTIAVAAIYLVLARPGHALQARLTHDGGNGNANRAALSDSLEVEDATEHWGYTVFARRDDLSDDRTLANAAALMQAGKRFGGHAFYLGLGAHFRQQKLNARSAEPADFLPAAGLSWHHDLFRTDVAASAKMTRAALAFLVQAGIPLELNTEFEALYSQPYRWSANVFAFVSRYGGLILGYEPVSVRARAGLWLKPLEHLQLRSLMRISPGVETYWEFSLSYSIQVDHSDPAEPVLKTTPAEKKIAAPKKPQTVPAFATLVKWGLTPVEALKYAREKDICSLSASAQAALKRHHWECRS
jgi:hypothetical protein